MKEIKYIDRKTNEIIYEKPPGEGFLKFLYYNPFGKLSLELLVKRKFLSSLYGRLMNRKSSKKKIKSFVENYKINMDDAVLGVDDFACFNEFFYRALKPEARKIADGFVSPADGKILAFENIDALNQFFVKGQPFTLAEFLKDDKLAQKYEGGTLILVRLAPNDYHRFHFPYAGDASNAHKISGHYYSVSPYAVSQNFGKIFCENKREYTVLSTKDKGDVLLCPVGATMVGSIIETYQANATVDKGAEMGYFTFGGSSVLVVVEKGKVKLDEDIVQNTKNGMETSILMGQQIGI
ncbi:MAG: phosphatidylserine decarboxylase [Saprospiraceae bacterium]|nr:phosphatidylserine decarboxylase [Saprospiraceae bacterium]